jgi:hypothetical protein
MSTSHYPTSLKLYKSSLRLFEIFQRTTRSGFTGIWLGILDRKNLQLMDQFFYDGESEQFDENYQQEDYNRSGLWDWEEKAIHTHFQSCSPLLVAGVGGGREVFALSQLGYEVDSFECNERLVDFANSFLAKAGIATTVRHAPQDICPDFDRVYGGLIVGWSAYTHIQGRQRRIEFLKKMRSHVAPQAPILLSFHYRSEANPSYPLTAFSGNLIRRLLRRELIEVGDTLLHQCGCAHYFTQEEIEFELNQSGFKLEFYSTKSYGNAVGVAI